MKILVINCGSSSIKYKVYEMPDEKLLVKGLVEKIGEETSYLKHELPHKSFEDENKIDNHSQALEIICRYLLDEEKGVIERIEEIKGVGHRVVHGGEGFEKSVVIDEGVLKKIEEYISLAPLHNPHNLAGIRASQKIFPEAVQVAAFDTAFHATIPPVAYLYGLPYYLYKEYRIRKYGFHGTSHHYVSRRAAEIMGKNNGINAITCHLGNGCSITAVKNGHSVDTSMGLTPLEGLIMGTRSGDIDPGIIFYLADKLGFDLKRINTLLNKESGFLGISGVSNDFRNLLESAKGGNERATLSIDMFCYRLRKYIGAYMAVLGSVDAIIFTGGIGENAPLVREKSLENLDRFGVILDEDKNKETVGKEGEISAPDSLIKLFVIPTDEELRIAVDSYLILTKSSYS